MSVTILGTATRENASSIMAFINEMLHEADGMVAINILVNVLAYQGTGRGVEKEEFMADITKLLGEVYTAQLNSINEQIQ